MLSNRNFLKRSHKTAGIAYVPLGDNLGARPNDRICYVEGMARYDLIAATEAFATGLDRIVKGADRYQVTLCQLGIMLKIWVNII